MGYFKEFACASTVESNPYMAGVDIESAALSYSCVVLMIYIIMKLVYTSGQCAETWLN